MQNGSSPQGTYLHAKPEYWHYRGSCVRTSDRTSLQIEFSIGFGVCHRKSVGLCRKWFFMGVTLRCHIDAPLPECKRRTPQNPVVTQPLAIIKKNKTIFNLIEKPISGHFIFLPVVRLRIGLCFSNFRFRSVLTLNDSITSKSTLPKPHTHTHTLPSAWSIRTTFGSVLGKIKWKMSANFP